MSRRCRVADGRGETLLELLIAVTIMGIAVVAIMAGLTTSVLMSDIHRKQATAGTAVRDYAEALQTFVAAPDKYVDNCGSTAPYGLPSFTVPTGFAKTVVPGSIRYWNGSTWQSTCTTDKGLQKLTLQVASIPDGRASERVDVVLRKPCSLETSSCS